MTRDTRDRAEFDRLYAARPDPWNYASSDYEARKYAATIAALPRRHYRSALDVGCSIGVLTERLAARCDDLLAVEPVEAALAEARRRGAHHPHLRFALLFVPGDWPQERFDLILISEVLDYLGAADLRRLAERLLGSLAPGGDLLMVHWVGKKGPVSSGHETTDVLVRTMGDALVPLRAERNPDYRLDLLRRA